MPYSFAALNADKTEEQYRKDFELLKNKQPDFSVNDCDSNESNTPLIVAAAKRGYVNAVKALMANPALNINAADAQGFTALRYACANKFNKQFQLIKELLKYKNKSSGQVANISSIDSENRTPFDYLPISVCRNQETRLAEPDIAQQLIYHVCRCGRLDAFLQLHDKIKQNDPNRNYINDYESNDEPSTPLHLAIEGGHDYLVSAIIDAGGDIKKTQDENGTNNSALHIAAHTLRPSIVTILISKGANPNDTNSCNQTPLMFAFDQRENDEESNKKLIEIISKFSELPQGKFFAKEDIKSRRTKKGDEERGFGETYLHIALRRQKPLRVNIGFNEYLKLTDFILDVLPDNSPLFNAVTNDGYTPLQYAAEFHYEAIPRLIEKGASFILNNKECPTILHYIFKNKFINAFDLLLNNLSGNAFTELMAIRSDVTHEYVLHLAAKEDSQAFTKLLRKIDENKQIQSVEINVKVDLINAIDAEGNTPLHYAVNHLLNVEALLKYNVNLILRNKNNESVFDLAIRQNRYNIIVKLLEKITEKQLLDLIAQQNSQGLTLLHEAAKVEGGKDYQGDKENILNLILTKVGSPKEISQLLNLKDGNGNTIFDIALSNEKYRNCLVLQEKGISLSGLDVKYQQAILRAKSEKHDRQIEYMNKERARKAKEEEQAKLKSLRDKRASTNLTGLVLPTSNPRSRGLSFAGTSSADSASPPATPPLQQLRENLSNRATPSLESGLSEAGANQSHDPKTDSSSTLSSAPGSARSLAELTKESEQLLGFDTKNDKYLSTFIRIKNKISYSRVWQHIARNKYKYLIGGIGGLLLLSGFLALCVFCPPVAAKIAVLALIKTLFIKTHLATAASQWLTPVASTLAVAAPTIIFTTLGLVGLGFTYGACKIIDFAKWFSSLFSSESKADSQIKTQNDYRAIATDENKSEIISRVTNDKPSAVVTENPNSTSGNNINESGFSAWFRSKDRNYFQPIGNAIKTNLCLFCCGSADGKEDENEIENKQIKSDSVRQNDHNSRAAPVI